MTGVTGPDVSVYQKGWKPAATDSFVFCKATEGRTYTNPEYAAQIAAGRKAGLVVGAYHFMRPGNAKAQAAYFVKVAGLKPGDLAVADWENTPEGHPSVADAAEFIAEVKRLLPQCRVLLYCNRSDWMSTTVKAPDGLWIAEYGVSKPNTTTDWIFHQYTDKPFDQNRAKFATKAELQAWARGLIPTKPTVQYLKLARTTVPTLLFDLSSLKRKDLWQGLAWSPRVMVGKRGFGGEWIVQQAYPGKIQNQVFHRFTKAGKLIGSMETVDSDHGNGNFHIRRSIKGNLWIWVGWNGRTVRILWRKGVWRRGQDKNVQTINTGITSASQSPIPTDPWRIVIRTATDTTETFTEFKERDLLARKPKPVRKVTIPKKGRGTHQGSAAFGKYVYVLNGSTGQKHYLHTYDWTGRLVRRVDVSDLDIPSALSTSDEPEGIAIYGNRLAILKRFNSVARRKLGLYLIAK